MIGYGIGYIGQAASYNFMAVYLVVFLTGCVGINAAQAASISSLALLLEVAIGMIVGNLSDRCTLKLGRRIPFILAAATSMIPIFGLCFASVGFSGTARFAYYLAFAMLFRIFFSCFEIPYQALGAEVAKDYDSRTRLRTVARCFSIFGSALGYIFPLWILDIFPDNIHLAWQIIGLFFGIVTSVSWFSAAAINRRKDRILSPSDVTKKSIAVFDILKNYKELLCLRTAKYMVGYKGAFTCAYALNNVAAIYYLTEALKLDNKYTAYIYFINIIIFAIMTPIVSKTALKYGKNRQQTVMMLITAVIGIFVFVFGRYSPVLGAAYMGVFSAMQTSFWQISPAIFYDVIEIDEWVNHKRREGDMMSMISVLGTLISSIMIAFFGFALDKAGYASGAAVQNESTVWFLSVIFILVPSLCLLAGTVSLALNPVNKENFENLRAAIKCRNNGEDYSQYLSSIDEIL